MMISIIMLALFIEAIVSALKPLWKEGGEPLSLTEIISLCMGVLVAVALKIDLFFAITGMDFAWETPVWMDYVFYVMSGVAIGRGPSFVADLWKGLKAWQEYNDMDPDDFEPVPVRMVSDQPEEQPISKAPSPRELSAQQTEGVSPASAMPILSADEARQAIHTREAGQPPIQTAPSPRELSAQQTEGVTQPSCSTKDWCDLDENGNMIPEEPESDPKD